MPLGLYLSVPFCRSKCTYCNFASDVFSKTNFPPYVERLCLDLEQASAISEQMGAIFEPTIDTIYLGGGTPTLLALSQLQQLFGTISQTFEVLPTAEITVECAPGTLTSDAIDALRLSGVNRVSLGVQSFVNAEAASVGRLHTFGTILDDIANLRAAGISEINLDLIAGLPHQTMQSWKFSVEHAISSQVPHISVYMLEVDSDSRLGREMIAGGVKYHAHFVPDQDLTADFYLRACELLESAGLEQYEISNFARRGHQSRHNLKYWKRLPYLGFGVDAHSMLRTIGGDAVRFSSPDSLQAYLAGVPAGRSIVNRQAAIEETFFLGLRLTSGVDLAQVSADFGETALAEFRPVIAEMLAMGLMERRENCIRLTARGRLLSNEVFERFIASPVA
jgi:putative oxygen-independent coproporphyrinogen III oxidase